MSKREVYGDAFPSVVCMKCLFVNLLFVAILNCWPNLSLVFVQKFLHELNFSCLTNFLYFALSRCRSARQLGSPEFLNFFLSADILFHWERRAAFHQSKER